MIRVFIDQKPENYIPDAEIDNWLDKIVKEQPKEVRICTYMQLTLLRTLHVKELIAIEAVIDGDEIFLVNSLGEMDSGNLFTKECEVVVDFLQEQLNKRIKEGEEK